MPSRTISAEAGNGAQTAELNTRKDKGERCQSLARKTMEGLTITLLLRDVLKGQNIKRPAENDNVTNCRTRQTIPALKT
jgi:hypothetical protein